VKLAATVAGLYCSGMKQIWTGRMAQAAGRYGDHAPMATVCCNACRTCVTTNIFGLALAAIAGAGFTLVRFAKRIFKHS
jgi:hypothetical protein